jgi:hypothetical protein
VQHYQRHGDPAGMTVNGQQPQLIWRVSSFVDVCEPEGSPRLLEPVGDVGRVQGLAVGLGEHEAGVGPGATEGDAVTVLALAMEGEDGEGGGVDGEPSPLTLLQVWLDLLQSSYLVLTYLAAALIAMALYRAGWITAGPTRVVATLGILLATAATAGGVLGSVSAELGAAGASIAFALTIPFMSTLLPSLLGAAIGERPESGKVSIGPLPLDRRI